MSSKQLTVYAPIIPGQDPSGRDRTGIFFPDKFVPGANLDLILYFHGLLNRCGGSANDSVEKYWTNKYFLLRDWMNSSNKNAVLVVPRLGATDKNYSKLGMEGDDFLRNLLAYISERVKSDPFSWTGSMAIRNIILAAHSGGGTTMVRLAQTVTLGKVRECWGLDSFYYLEVSKSLKDWAAKGGKFFLFWTDMGGTKDNVVEFQELLNKKENAFAARNIFIKKASDSSLLFSATTSDHCAVPQTFWPDLIGRKDNGLS
jgi:hypothetical protein